MKLKVINDRVLIRVSPPVAEYGPFGIVLARESRDDEHIGEVVACPEDGAVTAGDKVLFRRLPDGVPYETVIVGDEELLVLREQDLLAVVED